MSIELTRTMQATPAEGIRFATPHRVHYPGQAPKVQWEMDSAGLAQMKKALDADGNNTINRSDMEALGLNWNDALDRLFFGMNGEANTPELFYMAHVLHMGEASTAPKQLGIMPADNWGDGLVNLSEAAMSRLKTMASYRNIAPEQQAWADYLLIQTDTQHSVWPSLTNYQPTAADQREIEAVRQQYEAIVYYPPLYARPEAEAARPAPVPVSNTTETPAGGPPEATANPAVVATEQQPQQAPAEKPSSRSRHLMMWRK